MAKFDLNFSIDDLDMSSMTDYEKSVWIKKLYFAINDDFGRATVLSDIIRQQTSQEYIEKNHGINNAIDEFVKSEQIKNSQKHMVRIYPTYIVFNGYSLVSKSGKTEQPNIQIWHSGANSPTTIYPKDERDYEIQKKTAKDSLEKYGYITIDGGEIL